MVRQSRRKPQSLSHISQSRLPWDALSSAAFLTFCFSPQVWKEIDDFYVLMCAEGNGHILKHAENLRKLDIPFPGRVCPQMGRIPRWETRFGLIVSLVASLEFRVTSFLLVITAQINPPCAANYHVLCPE